MEYTHFEENINPNQKHDITTTMSARIKSLRNEFSYTISEAAFNLDFSDSTLSDMETNRKQTITYKQLCALSSVYRCSIDYILCLTNERNGYVNNKTNPITFSRNLRTISEYLQQNRYKGLVDDLAFCLKNIPDKYNQHIFAFISNFASIFRNNPMLIASDIPQETLNQFRDAKVQNDKYYALHHSQFIAAQKDLRDNHNLQTAICKFLSIYKEYPGTQDAVKSLEYIRNISVDPRFDETSLSDENQVLLHTILENHSH